MNFRSVADLARCLAYNTPTIGQDVDVVVGIPRSGLLAANLLALYLNRPLTDVEGLIEGRIMECGHHRTPSGQESGLFPGARVLVLDDSVCSGRSITRVRSRLEEADVPYEITYAAVYATHEVSGHVDVFLEVCKRPRIFEWNLMHHSHLLEACVDMDGVLCVDPTREQNDDGDRYMQFLKRAAPKFIPTQPVGYVVTARLEKYREPTERWLDSHGVRYHELLMLDLPNKEARRRSRGHAAFKATAYSETGARLFIESSPRQAAEIARLSGKPVICVDPARVYEPNGMEKGRAAVGELMQDPGGFIRTAMREGYRRSRRRLKKAFA